MPDLEIAVTVTALTPVDDPVRGWCTPCALPSLLSWTFAIEANGHLFDGRLTSLSICTDCGVVRWTQ